MQTNNLNSITPPFLKKGDQIEIIATARFVSKQTVYDSINIIESFDLKAKCNINFLSKRNIFSDNKINRLNALQNALNSKDNKAIFFARGGYGTVQLLDSVDFSILLQHPKWLVGFSDITIILNHILKLYNLKSIHGPMPFNYPHTKQDHIASIFQILKGEKNKILVKANSQNILGTGTGKLIGGNLSIIYSLMGSKSLFNLGKKSILFIEDVDEYLYHIERMMYGLNRCGLLKEINGLIVGGMDKIKDNELQFGKSIQDIIINVCEKYKYPICFDFPSGHSKDNHPLIIGETIKLSVNKVCAKIDYIK